MRSRVKPNVQARGLPPEVPPEELCPPAPARHARQGALLRAGRIDEVEQTVTFSQSARSPGAPLAAGRYRR